MTPAGSEHLDALVEIFLECWHSSYANVLPQPLVSSMTSSRARAIWERSLGDPISSLLVALAEDGKPIGVTRFGLLEDGVGIVHSLYVSPRVQGKGAGRMLLTEAGSGLAALGAGSAVLWVFEQNQPAREFYTRCGWSADGGRQVQPEFGEPEIRLHRSLEQHRDAE